ncbi:Dyp-type peroxidase [Brachybacterium saurashtrense]|uniref:Dyp-type peroxidase n=1 Tax=Brachybacterium saurashtrense TaxID=556288 RepID=A0A345YRE4_9MICO|nr:Dyp-type peroxidase [Brachybacterium saurashtrense]AXK46496.1 Dyp-type peroxidase [Brachybacterium saurashtrense]RRR24237.1 Dyp-type peroxidase [Brachybacterium saurashtrense]
MTAPQEHPLPDRPGRRHLLRAGTLGVGALGIGAAGAGLDRALRDPARTEAGSSRPDPAPYGGTAVPFHGAHQAGVETPAPAAATLLALDLRENVDRDGVLRMLRLLTDDAARLTQGEPALADTEPELAAEPASLTVTAGFGPGLMARADRPAPEWLAPLPAFGIDQLEEQWCDGDLLLQIAADDPLTVSHAARMLLKDSRAFATIRWSQTGFRRSPGVVRPGSTLRNLFGQLDGTANPAPGSEHFSTVVWRDEGPFAGGTSMVVRRIRMDLDGWDEADRGAREAATGTRLDSGAPLSGGDETTPADFEKVSANGFPVIGEFSHMRRARGVDDGEHQEIYRRPYNYEHAPSPGSGQLSEAGQVFISFQADPVAQFLPIQRRLDELDLLNQWTTPIGSAVFAIPPGCAEGEFLGQSVLE